MTRELLEEILKLPLAERLELVQELWDSIAADCEREPYPLTSEQQHDLQLRLAEADRAPHVPQCGRKTLVACVDT